MLVPPQLAAGRWQLAAGEVGLTRWHAGFYVERCPARLLAGCRILGWVALGAVAQMGERRVRNAEVRGSIPLSSICWGVGA